MRGGSVMAVLGTEQLSEETLIAYATGTH